MVWTSLCDDAAKKEGKKDPESEVETNEEGVGAGQTKRAREGQDGVEAIEGTEPYRWRRGRLRVATAKAHWREPRDEGDVNDQDHR